jgi:hypothetical protein
MGVARVSEPTRSPGPDTDAGAGSSTEFDALTARLDALRAQLREEPSRGPDAATAPDSVPAPDPAPAPEVTLVPESEPEPEPASEPEPEPELEPASEPEPEPASELELEPASEPEPELESASEPEPAPQPGQEPTPIRSQAPEVVAVTVPDAPSTPWEPATRAFDRPAPLTRVLDGIRGGLELIRGRRGAGRGRVLIGAGAGALVVVVVLLIVVLSGDGDGTSDGGSSASGSTDVAPEVRFPPPAGMPADAVARVRPVAVRNVAIGFEAAIEGVTELPACDAAEVGSPDRVAWFDVSEVAETSSDTQLVAVAPGEAGTALLRVRATDRDPEPFGATSVGQLVEVARANGSVLRWDVVAIVDAPAGAPFPTDVLAAGDEPRLVLLACGTSSDRFVLTVPAR